MTRLSILMCSGLVLVACDRPPTSANNDSGPQSPTNDQAVASSNGVAPFGEGLGYPIVNSRGEKIGFVTNRLEKHGIKIRVDIDPDGLPPGPHGMHVHEFGLCDPPAFNTAGAHWNPAGKQHGHKNPRGPHLGDLGNIEVAADGSAHADGQIAIPVPAIGKPIGQTGLSLLIHANVDDDKTDPSGNSGERIACGILVPK